MLLFFRDIRVTCGSKRVAAVLYFYSPLQAQRGRTLSGSWSWFQETKDYLENREPVDKEDHQVPQEDLEFQVGVEQI